MFRIPTSVFTAAAVLALSSQALGQVSLPMQNYRLNPGTKTLGYDVLQGVTVDINQRDMRLAVKPTKELFYIPEAGTVTESGFSRSVAANCPAVQIAKDNETIIARAGQNIINTLERITATYDQQTQLYDQALLECSNANAKKAEQDALVLIFQTTLVEKSTALTTARGELQTCNLVTPGECDSLVTDVRNLAVEVTKASTELTNSRTILGPIAAAAAKECSESNSAGTTLATMFNNVTAANNTLVLIGQGADAELISMGEEFGGVVTAIVSSRSAKQQADLQEANPNAIVRPIQIQQATFSFAPAVSSSEAKRIKKATVLGVALAGAEPNPALPGTSAMQVFNATGGAGITVSLSRIGACSDDYRATAAFNFAFTGYNLVNGVAKWNKWATYSKLEETEKKGSLFGGKTNHKLVELIKAGEGFSFVLADASASIDPEKMRQDMMKAMADRVLTMWTDVKSIETGGSMVVPSIGPSGASVAADGLSKCPNLYCQIGSFSLKTLDAIFGKQVVRDDVFKEWKVDSSETFSYTKADRLTRNAPVQIVVRP